MTKVVFGLFGAGGFGREVMPYVKTSVVRTLGISPDLVEVMFVETSEPTTLKVNDYTLISIDQFLQLDSPRYFNVAIADGRAREAIVQRIGSLAQALPIHAPQTIFLDNNVVGTGSIFCPNSMLTSNVTIGRFFQANIYSYIAHDCVIGDFVTFAPGVRCNGRVHVHDYAYIGTNAIIKQGTSEKPLRIGVGATVGMGAVVTKDVPDGATVVGNPAREMYRNI